MERDERPQPQVWRAPPDQLQDEERVDHTTLGEVVALDVAVALATLVALLVAIGSRLEGTGAAKVGELAVPCLGAAALVVLADRVSHRALPRWVHVVGVALLGAVLALAAQAGELRGEGAASRVVDEDPRGGWKTVEMDGVRVDVPDAWDRVEVEGCPSVHEHWALEGAGCGDDQGLALLGSATFDPADGPGVHRYGDGGSPRWGGYVLVGDLAVNVFDDDRDLVQAVLDSAREVAPRVDP